MTKGKNKLKISEVKINLLPNPTPKGILGYASCLINNSFKINNIAIALSIKRKGNFRLIYPITKSNTEYIQAIYPIKKSIANQIENEILKVFRNVIGKDGK